MNDYQCYQILGIPEGSSIKDVKSAYRKLALQFHPDKNSNLGDSKFKLITEAYQEIKNNYKKAIHENSKKYDRNNKHDFSNSWGAQKSDRNHYEDWTRYTEYAENEYQTFWQRYEKAFWEYYDKVNSATTESFETVTPKSDVVVSVNVDPGRCIACCSCETIAPSVFKVEKNVKVNPKSRVINENGAQSEKILDAAQTCPTKAISVIDRESLRRLYPW